MSLPEDDDDKMNKAERLAVAGAIAPHLRDHCERAASRRVARVDAEGNVVGYMTLADAQRAILARQKIEFDVQPGVRPDVVFCEFCGRRVKILVKVGIPRRVCHGGCAKQQTCAIHGCTETPGENAFSAGAVRRRGGRPWVCRRHAIERMREAGNRRVARVATKEEDES